MTTTMDKVITCRLCFDSNHSLLNIFNETDLNGVQIAKILAEHIGEVISMGKLQKKKPKLKKKTQLIPKLFIPCYE